MLRRGEDRIEGDALKLHATAKLKYSGKKIVRNALLPVLTFSVITFYLPGTSVSR
jgi:hypothetical protein